MKGDEKTLKRLEEALGRIIQGIPERIPLNSTLSVSAVEDEAQMGHGSAYYYPELVQEVKKIQKRWQSVQYGAAPNNQRERV